MNEKEIRELLNLFLGKEVLLLVSRNKEAPYYDKMETIKGVLHFERVDGVPTHVMEGGSPLYKVNYTSFYVSEIMNIQFLHVENMSPKITITIEG